MYCIVLKLLYLCSDFVFFLNEKLKIKNEKWNNSELRTRNSEQ